jgi:hypothetical protein
MLRVNNNAIYFGKEKDMTKTKRERAEELAVRIEEMSNRKKLLLQEAKEEERKNRTHRLCKRGGLLESLLPDTLNLDDDQFRNFLEMTMLTTYARDRFSDAQAGKLSHHSTAQAKTAASAGIGNSKSINPKQSSNSTDAQMANESPQAGVFEDVVA